MPGSGGVIQLDRGLIPHDLPPREVSHAILRALGVPESDLSAVETTLIHLPDSPLIIFRFTSRKVLKGLRKMKDDAAPLPDLTRRIDPDVLDIQLSRRRVD